MVTRRCSKIAILKGMRALHEDANPQERKALINEYKRALAAYLEPRLGREKGIFCLKAGSNGELRAFEPILYPRQGFSRTSRATGDSRPLCSLTKALAERIIRQFAN
jgi:hypothetical protein